MPLLTSFQVDSPNVTYTDAAITSRYAYTRTVITPGDGNGTPARATPVTDTYTISTKRVIPKTGVMFVGWGGNNGTTTTAMLLANAKGLTWETRRGPQAANYYGSVTQSGTVRVGADASGAEYHCPLGTLLPLVHPNDLAVDGWDISGLNLGDAMRRARVLEPTLIGQLHGEMSKLKPRPSIFNPSFVAANQAARADNALPADLPLADAVERIRADIRDFKTSRGLDKVLVLWTANTERFADVRPGLNDTADNLLAAIAANDPEVSPSTLFAVACISEGVTFINGSPQNTFVPGCVELAERHRTFIAGDDFKSGQTKLKSVLVDYLVSAGIKPVSIASYNHLGNNDGFNLSAPETFRSKEISKSNVVDDMIASNGILYDHAGGEKPDHTVVIKYMPYVGDSKRAIDEYISEIAMGGQNTLAIHNTCEDSLLAAPLILDLLLLAEICERMRFRKEETAANAAATGAGAATAASAAAAADAADAEDVELVSFHSVLSLLSYLTKAPLVPKGAPVVNALAAQRSAVENMFKAAVGLPPESHMALEHRLAAAPAAAAIAGSSS